MRKVLFKPARPGTALAALLLVVAVVSTSSGQVLPPSSLPYGYSYEEWSAKWWQWNLGQSTNHHDLLGDPGICNGPASRVRFPARSFAPSSGGISVITNHIVVPAGTALFFPILDTWADNGACPLSAFTSFTAEQLAAFNAQRWGAVTETACLIDGVAVAGLEDPANTLYRVVSPPFSYTTAEKDNVLAGFFGASCIPGGLTIYPAAAEGVYLMLAPLPPGKHTIRTIAVVGPPDAPFVKLDVTSFITVRRDQDGGHDRDDR